MNGKKAKALRKANPVDHALNTALKSKRAADTLDRKQALELERAEVRAEKAEERARQRVGFVGRFGGRVVG